MKMSGVLKISYYIVYVLPWGIGCYKHTSIQLLNIPFVLMGQRQSPKQNTPCMPIMVNSQQHDDSPAKYQLKTKKFKET